MTDIDGDSLTVSSNIGNPVMNELVIDSSGASHWYGVIDFDMADLCGEIFDGSLEIIAIDQDQAADTAVFGPLSITGAISFTLDSNLYIWPGELEWMPVYLDIPDDICLGSFVLTIIYADSILNVLDCRRGDILEGGEYFNIYYNHPGPGSIMISFINDLENGETADEICGIANDEAIVEIKFLLSAEPNYPINFSSPVTFSDQESNYLYNNVTNKDSSFIWSLEGCDVSPGPGYEESMQLNLNSGNICVLSEYGGGFQPGDLNLNHIPWEISDVLMAANALADCSLYSFNHRQMRASDIDGDDYSLTIADFMYFIGVGQGVVDPVDLIIPYDFSHYPSLDTLFIQSVQASPGDTLALPIYLRTADTLIGLQFYIDIYHHFVTFDTLILNDDINLSQAICSGYPHVYTFDLDMNNPDLIYPGFYHLADLVVTVSPDIYFPSRAQVVFSSEPGDLVYTGLSNPTFFEPVLVNGEVVIDP